MRQSLHSDSNTSSSVTVSAPFWHIRRKKPSYLLLNFSNFQELIISSLVRSLTGIVLNILNSPAGLSESPRVSEKQDLPAEVQTWKPQNLFYAKSSLSQCSCHVKNAWRNVEGSASAFMTCVWGCLGLCVCVCVCVWIQWGWFCTTVWMCGCVHMCSPAGTSFILVLKWKYSEL